MPLIETGPDRKRRELRRQIAKAAQAEKTKIPEATIDRKTKSNKDEPKI